MCFIPKTSLVHFAVIRHAFPGQISGTQIESPTARRFTSLKASSDWVRNFGHPMHVQAFVSVEFLNKVLLMRSHRLIEQYMDGAPDQLILLAKDPIIDLTDRLCGQRESESTEIERIEFEIINVAGPGVTMPGMHAEVVYGADIASSIERWKEDAEGLSGLVIGHVSIEIHRNELSPDARSAIESKDFGEPEPLEALIGGKIVDIMRRFVTA